MPKKSAPKPARTTKPKTDAPSWRDTDPSADAKTAAEVVQSNLEAALVDHITEHGATSRDDLIEAMTLEDFEDKDQINKTISDMIRSDALDIDEDNLLVLPKVEGLNGETNGVAKTNGVNGHAAPSQNFAAGEGEALKSAQADGTRYLECELTVEEITELRVQREDIDEEIDDLQMRHDEAKKLASGLQKRIDVRADEGRALSRRVRTGLEYRHVRCSESRGVDTREGFPCTGVVGVVTTRLDTGEAIEWRELRYDEKQGKLFDDAAANA